MSVIEINHITKDYGHHKGVFDVSFVVEEGEVLGFLGPNGSGKTTTIRQLMGFMKPDQGDVKILGMNCFDDAKQVQGKLGYLPGEIAFMEDMTGQEFIRFIAKMKNMKDISYAEELMQFLELDARGKMKRMSKGMKQKIGIVIAFMQDAPILILDEPTSGLDPLMQNKFVELIQQAKKDGKTVLMSSHIFEEVENTCDRVVMIKEGHVVATETMENLRKNRLKHYEIHFYDENDAIAFMEKYHQAKRDGAIIHLMLKGHTNQLLQDLSQYDIDDFNARPQSLEELFLHYYGGEEK
ncbi:ABC transporter ATP-binding protein [Candidatus Stoquefichus massiliensis]|uniref:ABC transporter ATP-binding protein n=1 Tax=Candidatus Stoquefichus massiliensis TaxID=1470350 RepID=UPI000486EF95|nr:ABC transporter ATP-binding protein [Candidatus Stoquefichus massiliensis]